MEEILMLKSHVKQCLNSLVYMAFIFQRHILLVLRHKSHFFTFFSNGIHIFFTFILYIITHRRR